MYSNGRAVHEMKKHRSLVCAFFFSSLALVGAGVLADGDNRAGEEDGYHPLALHESIRDDGGECYLGHSKKIEDELVRFFRAKKKEGG